MTNVTKNTTEPDWIVTNQCFVGAEWVLVYMQSIQVSGRRDLKLETWDLQFSLPLSLSLSLVPSLLQPP